LGLPVEAVAEDGSSWVDAGVEQLIVQLSDVEAVRACLPSPGLMAQHLTTPGRPPHVYVWAWTGESSLEARLFALSGTALDEDPATGSACANLGGWLASQGHRGVEIAVSQGAQVRRPSRLELTISGDGKVLVGGHVHEVGEGIVRMEG
jgi:PhzF family phenazine biosynthesis protein